MRPNSNNAKNERTKNMCAHAHVSLADFSANGWKMCQFPKVSISYNICRGMSCTHHIHIHKAVWMTNTGDIQWSVWERINEKKSDVEGNEDEKGEYGGFKPQTGPRKSICWFLSAFIKCTWRIAFIVMKMCECVCGVCVCTCVRFCIPLSNKTRSHTHTHIEHQIFNNS